MQYKLHSYICSYYFVHKLCSICNIIALHECKRALRFILSNKKKTEKFSSNYSGIVPCEHKVSFFSEHAVALKAPHNSLSPHMNIFFAVYKFMSINFMRTKRSLGVHVSSIICGTTWWRLDNRWIVKTSWSKLSACSGWSGEHSWQKTGWGHSAVRRYIELPTGRPIQLYDQLDKGHLDQRRILAFLIFVDSVSTLTLWVEKERRKFSWIIISYKKKLFLLKKIFQWKPYDIFIINENK